MVDISGLKPTAVLMALYDRAKPQGLGMLHFDPMPMTEEEATDLLARWPSGEKPYFDYVHGRVMKVEIHGDALDEAPYDRDNGAGAAARAIAELRT